MTVTQREQKQTALTGTVEIKHIFLDMDGVMADFVGGVIDLLKLDHFKALNEWPRGEYSMETALGITTDRLWNLINRNGSEWWAHLDPFEWNKHLLSMVIECRAAPSILTSPGDCAYAYTGKRLWAEKHLSGFPLHLTSQKHLLAKPSSLLIDDSDRNCEQFREDGGHAIVFPQPWNSQHGETFRRMAYIREQLQEFGVF